MVRQWQTLFYGRRYSNTMLGDGIDYAKVAEACGCKGVTITSLDDFKEAFKEAMKSTDQPVVLNCLIDEDEKVWPMVAPGASISEAFSEEDMIRK